VRTRIGLANQLRDQLACFWPGASKVFWSVDSQIALAFLRRYVGDPKAANWNESAGSDPESGNSWRVCDMVAKLEEALGRSHSDPGAARWRVLWSKLSANQKSQYTQARGQRPRKRR
jgi:hypothetical protein